MPWSKEDFLRNNAFSLYDIWPHPSAKTPAPGVKKFTILVDPSLVIIKCQDPSASVAGIKTLGSKFSIVNVDYSFFT